jgi:phenylacetate-coenzyme A ligase PaaK-like adenylate-forming protein
MHLRKVVPPSSTCRPTSSSALDAMETLSRDEMAALRADRRKRTLHAVYEDVLAYPKKFGAAGSGLFRQREPGCK